MKIKMFRTIRAMKQILNPILHKSYKRLAPVEGNNQPWFGLNPIHNKSIENGHKNLIRLGGNRVYQIRSSLICWVLLLSAFASFANPVQSVNDGMWSDASTWSTGTIPTLTDDVIIADNHVVSLDLSPSGNEVIELCHSLTVEGSAVLQLGHNEDNLEKVFQLTGNLVCEGTIAAGREVPADGSTGEGLIYTNNSSFLFSLTDANTVISGKGYFHPSNLYFVNESTEKSVTIDHYNMVIDHDFIVEGMGKVNIEVAHFSYLNVRGTLGVTGADFASSSANYTASLEIGGIVQCGNLGLFTKNTSESSLIHLSNEGVLDVDQINGGEALTSAAGGIELRIDQYSIFRCGQGVESPEVIAGQDVNVVVNNNGEIKLHYTEMLTSSDDVLTQVNAFDQTDETQILPIRHQIGASHIAGWYNFTDQSFMQEGISRFKEWGSTNIKTTVSANNNKMFEAYPFNHDWPSFNEPAEVIAHDDMDSLFSDPYFTKHAFWAPSKGVNGYYKEGADRNHDRFLDTEDQIYEAAKVLLEKYGHMNKTFLFQNWEGDWMLRGTNRQWEDNPSSIPDDIEWQVEGMARMWRAHIRGIEKAVAEFPDAIAKIQYAVEFNKLWKNVNGTRVTMMDLNVPCVIADVVPKVRMHLSSWSAYDGNFEEGDRPFPTGYWNGLEIAAYYTNNTKEIDGFPVQLGEIGMNENPPYQSLGDDEIRDRYDEIVGMVAALNVPNVYLWNLYGSGQQGVDLVKGEQYETDYLYQVLDGKWVFEPDGSLGVAASQLKDNYFLIIPNEAPEIVNPIENQVLDAGFEILNIDLSGVFSDPNGDIFSLTIAVEDERVVTATLADSILTLAEGGLGVTTISVTANDGLGGETILSFEVRVNSSTEAIVFIRDIFYPTITEALTAAVDGDTIEVRGVHIEPIGINKSVTIRGENPLVDIILAADYGEVATSRVVSIARGNDFTGDLTVTLENLGIKHGVSSQNGGGISADKVTGLLTLRNLIIEDNAADRNGGGLSVAGSNVDIIECTIQQNTATLDGGGAIFSPNNGVSIDSEVNIYRSLINSNTGRNGGGVYINGNKDFGNDRLITVYLENSTISNNSTTSGTSGSGGGGIWSKCAFWTGDGTTPNVSLQLVHATFYNNVHSSTTKNGIQFTSTASGATTNFSIYNSIVVTAEDVSQKALNFANANTIDVVNCILGGLNAAPELVNDEDKNNVTGKLAGFAGISTSLSDEGGHVKVLALADNANAIDYCTASTGISLPSDDARNNMRDSNPDAGAFEFGDNNFAPVVANEIADQVFDTGFSADIIDLSNTFTDTDGDMLTLSVSVADEMVVTGVISDTNLILTEVGEGTTIVTVTADDGRGGTVADTFEVAVSGVVSGLEDEDFFSIYPNPTSGPLQVSLAENKVDIFIYTIAGQTVFEAEYLGPSRYELSNLENGIYLLKAITKTGQHFHYRLVIDK